MAEGGFVVTFDDVGEHRCYAVSFDYDLWVYKINNEKPRSIPPGTQRIVVEIEAEPSTDDMQQKK